MRLIIIRHAESQANSLGHHQGRKGCWRNTPLSKNGIGQAREIAKRLKNEKISEFYSSDLKRTRQTAEEISKLNNLRIKYDKRLREKTDEETTEDFIFRVKSFFDEMKNKEGDILVVAHGGVNLTLLAISTGNRKKGGKIIRRYKQANTGVNIIEKEGRHYKIRLINSIKHFKKDKTLIKIFEKTQKRDYNNVGYDNHKRKVLLLENLLNKKRYKTKRIKIIFDWKDLPIPKSILGILKKSSTIWVHDALAVGIHGGYLLLDPAWSPKLEKKGFPVTKDWDGLEDTKQITKGELEFFKEKSFEKDKEEILKNHKIKIEKEEAFKFIKALNKWLRK